MKKAGLLILFLVCRPVLALACEVCKARQPAGWQGITHGAGPQGNTDLVITWVAVAIVGITLFFSIKYLVKPQESAPGHIKNSIIG